MSTFRRLALATAALPFSLALAACSDDAVDGAVDAEPVAVVPAPEGSSWDQQVVRTEEGGWQVGNPDAPIKLVEYGSLTCPACARFSQDGAEAITNEYVQSGRVSFEFRSVPIHGLPDLLMTRLIECAPETAAVPLADQIWANLETIDAGFRTNGTAVQSAFELPQDQRFAAVGEVSGLTDFFASRGISRDQARVCLSDSEAIIALGDRLQEQTTADNVQSTPTFFLNGRQLDERSWTEIEAILQRAGARDE